MSQLQVKWRGGFSDRNKLININKSIQTKNFDEMTRNAIFNLIANILKIVGRSSREQDFIEYIYIPMFLIREYQRFQEFMGIQIILCQKL